ncbi:MAG: signal peptide peptidase SppA [Deltaproteobacteria bacterium]|nr:signal peptide peptidase SppA [Candidatus Zymogenaceae bacterium]
MKKRTRTLFRRGVIAVIPIEGVISVKQVDPYLDLIERAEKTRKIRGVLIKLSSQGGSITGTELLYMAMMRLKEKKPLFVWTTMAASGGYYAACAADKILAPSTAIIGSIGVISIKPVISGLLSKIGLKMEVLKEGEYKDESFFFKNTTKEGRERAQAINKEVYEDFVSVVALGRGLDDETAHSVATGEIFTAKRGLSLGLVDGLGDFRDALEELAREVGVPEERVVYLKPRRSLLSGIFDRSLARGARGILEEFFG